MLALCIPQIYSAHVAMWAPSLSRQRLKKHLLLKNWYKYLLKSAIPKLAGRGHHGEPQRKGAAGQKQRMEPDQGTMGRGGQQGCMANSGLPPHEQEFRANAPQFQQHLPEAPEVRPAWSAQLSSGWTVQGSSTSEGPAALAVPSLQLPQQMLKPQDQACLSSPLLTHQPVL